ncbi:MAG: hypothetical protein ABJB11_00200 [Ferruginibacter sp.]
MNTSDNFPTTSPESRPEKKDYRNLVIGILAAGIIGLGGYLAVDKNKTGEVIKQQEGTIATVTTEKSEVQKSFDASLARLDSMSTANTTLESSLKEKNGEVSKVKAEIRSILNKKNATAAELSRAKTLIASLNTTIESMQADIARLTQDNETLTQDKVVLNQEKVKLTEDLTATTVVKEELAKKVDIASTLNASNILITPINVKNNGKEKVSTVAKRVDKLVVSFDVVNRIAQSGTTDVYVLVIGPDGKPVSAESLGSGTFTTREEGDKSFTAKLPVELETAKKRNVEFAFKPGVNFQTGNYTIQIYQNGFKIGEGTRSLKKGGLFS